MNNEALQEAMRGLVEKRHSLMFTKTIIEGYGMSDQFQATMACIAELDKSLRELEKLVK